MSPDPEHYPNHSHAAHGLMLGVDPGLQRTGYALIMPLDDQRPARVVEAGVIRINPKLPLERRLLELENNLDQLIAGHKPSAMAVEQLYAHYKHPRTAIIMGHARGVILMVAAKRDLGVVHVSATHVKKHMTGAGHASKAQIQRAVAAALQLPAVPEPNDVADAMAVALAGIQMRRAQEQELQIAQGAAR